jgi:pimeloyl-ACP methyl ester carboxylesterase
MDITLKINSLSSTTLQISIVREYRLVLSKLMMVFAGLLLLSACDQAEPLQSSQSKSTNTTPTDTVQRYGRQSLFSYPEFSGKYAVASSSLTVEDFSRLEPFSAESVDNRKLQVRFYYPANKISTFESDKKLPIISQAAWDYLIGHQVLLGKKLRYSNYEKATWDINLDQPVNSGQGNFPVLIFSHGYGYNAESYTAMSAELASKGYIVVSINHSFGANPSKINDRLVWATPLNRDAIGAYLPIWSDDQILIIDKLVQLNSDSESLFFQKLDLSNLGLFGHSYGGAASYYTASRDPRVKAIMDIDGTIFNFENLFITQPFAFVLSKNHKPKFDYWNAGNKAFEIKLFEFEHITFTDYPLWWQWDHDQSELGLGKVDAHRAVELTVELVDDFFAHQSLLENSRWFNQSSQRNNELLVVRKN